MRHNKIIGWDSFLDVVERVQKVSPWLSRQIAKRASEWPFWASGLQVKEWNERQAWVQLPVSFRNIVDSEICQGHLVLAGELTLRLLMLRYRQEFPFNYHLSKCTVETHNRLSQNIDLKFEISFEAWETIRLELAKNSQTQAEFVFPARLQDGRLAATLTFQAAFELEKFLPA